jgi:hypothetical protein
LTLRRNAVTISTILGTGDCVSHSIVDARQNNDLYASPSRFMTMLYVAPDDVYSTSSSFSFASFSAMRGKLRFGEPFVITSLSRHDDTAVKKHSNPSAHCGDAYVH